MLDWSAAALERACNWMYSAIVAFGAIANRGAMPGVVDGLAGIA
jgi:hypothetical protein